MGTIGRGVRRRVGMVGISVLTAVGLLAACGLGEDTGSSEPSNDSGDEQSAEPGPFFGECGSVTDAEVRDLLNAGEFALVTRDSVGCVWEVGGSTSPAVTFSWYRGSPIARERAGSEMLGRPAQDVEIGGHPGFQGSAADVNGALVLCEIGIEFGADFQHWSVTYNQSAPTADPCAVAQSLAELSIERAS